MRYRENGSRYGGYSSYGGNYNGGRYDRTNRFGRRSRYTNDYGGCNGYGGSYSGGGYDSGYGRPSLFMRIRLMLHKRRRVRQAKRIYMEAQQQRIDGYVGKRYSKEHKPVESSLNTEEHATVPERSEAPARKTLLVRENIVYDSAEKMPDYRRIRINR